MSDKAEELTDDNSTMLLSISVSEEGIITCTLLNGATWAEGAKSLIDALNRICKHEVKVRKI